MEGRDGEKEMGSIKKTGSNGKNFERLTGLVTVRKTEGLRE